MAFSISSASMSVLPLTAYSICNTRGFIVSTVRRNFERSPPVRAAIVDRAGTRSSACSRPTCVAGLLRAQLKAVLALNIILTRGPFSKPMATHARFYSSVATRFMMVLSLCTWNWPLNHQPYSVPLCERGFLKKRLGGNAITQSHPIHAGWGGTDALMSGCFITMSWMEGGVSIDEALVTVDLDRDRFQLWPGRRTYPGIPRACFDVAFCFHW